MDEQVIAAGVLNMARMWETPARTMGGRWVRWEDAWAADSGLPSRMFNRTIIIRRLLSSSAAELAERIRRFYGTRTDGGPYLVVDTWATLDLEPYGFERWMTLPFMVRAPGGTHETRSDLEIRTVRSKNDVAMFVRALVEGFGISELRDLSAVQVLDERVLAEGSMRCWVALAHGEPVGTSVAYHSDGVVGVYLVGVVPAMRRHGLGEALTWHATLSDRSLPCTLEASSLGRPVYERMGYVTVLECQTWLATAR